MVRYKLKDICHKITDGSHNPPKGIELSEYLMLSSKNIYDDLITYDEPRYLTKEEFETENKRTDIQDGDVLLTIVGTVGRCAVYRSKENVKFVLQRSVAVLKPKLDIISPRYLMYKLISLSNVFQQEARGVAQKGIYLRQLADIQIDIPTLEIQENIIKTLDKASELLEKRKEQIQACDKLIKSQFIEMFGDVRLNPLGWETKTLGDVYEIIDGDRGKNYPKQDEFYDEGHCLFLNAGNVTASGFSFDKNMFISQEKDEVLRKGKLQRLDLVVTTRGTVGNIAYYDEDVPYEHVRINSGMVLLRQREHINPYFFIYYFRNPEVYQSLISGSAQPQMPISSMRTATIYMPPIELQNQFAGFVQQVDKLKFEMEKSLTEMENNFNALMQKAFKGELF